MVGGFPLHPQRLRHFRNSWFSSVPNGHTDLPGNVDALKALHALGVNVFAFDYQGFGKSQVGHPSQQKAYANGVAALRLFNWTPTFSRGPGSDLRRSTRCCRRCACRADFAKDRRTHPRRSAALAHPGGKTRAAHSSSAHVACFSGSI